MSNETKHTPGPWASQTVNERGQPTTYVTAKAGRRAVALVMGADLGEAKANADLISASPDLLAVAKSALRRLTAMEMLVDFRREIEAAIAKAEGKP